MTHDKKTSAAVEALEGMGWKKTDHPAVTLRMRIKCFFGLHEWIPLWEYHIKSGLLESRGRASICCHREEG